MTKTQEREALLPHQLIQFSSRRNCGWLRRSRNRNSPNACFRTANWRDFFNDSLVDGEWRPIDLEDILKTVHELGIHRMATTNFYKVNFSVGAHFSLSDEVDDPFLAFLWKVEEFGKVAEKRYWIPHKENTNPLTRYRSFDECDNTPH